MDELYSFIEKRLLNAKYADNYCCQASVSEEAMKRLKEKFYPIQHRDIIEGNFLVHKKRQEYCFYKVISPQLIISHDKNIFHVKYAEDSDGLFVYCPDLSLVFTHKLSQNDILRLKDSLEEEYQPEDRRKSIYMLSKLYLEADAEADDDHEAEMTSRSSFCSSTTNPGTNPGLARSPTVRSIARSVSFSDIEDVARVDPVKEANQDPYTPSNAKPRTFYDIFLYIVTCGML